MHLKQLKLAGFKSFVEPTVVPFPSQLVAVVGPNGCGKSNIIDAVRWVMGESSAKNLRGESMTDVIFNGSSQRKAVGQASVELVFDNSMGRLGGQYAAYQEIAVKRLVTRDGDSFYYLNGSRCRRRDITDIFLGTGAGARGYSIIGQGTISRLVEARPEELRAYLEEAAGVSKYKERRRETVLRITHTRENLARVADIRDELDKQLQRLERQAKAAERYKALKIEERLCKSEILALKWQALTAEQTARQNELKRLSLDYEQHQAKATEAYKQSVVLREKLQDDNDAFQQVQTNFYQLATEIARLEETIQQQQREKQRLKADQQQLQIDWQMATSQLQQDRHIQSTCEESLQELQEKLQSVRMELAVQQQAFQDKQQQYTHWLAETQQVQVALSKVRGEIQVQEVRLQHLNQRRQQILLQLQKIQDEQLLLATDDFVAELKSQQDDLTRLQAQLEQDDKQHQQVTAANSTFRQQLMAIEQALHQAQDDVHRLNTQQAALLAAQQSALRREHKAIDPTTAQWDKKPRLAEAMVVEKDWQAICEWVIGDGLQAIVLDSLDPLWPEMKHLQGTSSLFVSPVQRCEKAGAHPRLSDKIQGIQPNWIYQLDKIYTVSDFEEALSCLPTLQEDESIVTLDGYWLGKGWAKVADSTVDEEGLLLRQEKLTVVSKALSTAQTHLDTLKANRDQVHAQIKENECQLETTRQTLSLSRESLRDCEAQLRHKERALEQAQTRKDVLRTESEELGLELEELASQQDSASQLLQASIETSQQYEQQQGLLTNEKAAWESTLLTSKQAVDEGNAVLQASQLQAEREILKIKQLNENIQREEARLEILNERLELLANRLLELDNPDLTVNTTLSEKIKQHEELEIALSTRRESLSSLTQDLEASEALVRSEEKLSKTIQEKIQQEQMQEQALAVRASGIMDALAELDGQVELLLAAIPEGVTQPMREQALQDIIEKIQRLGAINLAAIEEYDSELQRKQHLDGQYQDLMEALATLDAAIEKMDKETQQRLQVTFDEVNTSFQALFPRLFGGGRAMLELTCDNLLEAGILVMAQPPGKRNSTIHLLSGGEKAMTAVALVFAIFRLNPSPFCMLDEVDAPLDDVNVGRFCDLVKEMSQFVQFLFITHNKVTMELAEHLIGVTMREPGVSRIVAVDVEQALSMSESSS